HLIDKTQDHTAWHRARCLPARKFEKVLVANRGEIAMRIYRAPIKSVGVYSEADTMHMHRTMADESYLIGKGLQPVQGVLEHFSHQFRLPRRLRQMLCILVIHRTPAWQAFRSRRSARPGEVRASLLGDKGARQVRPPSAPASQVVPGSPRAIGRDAAAADEEFCRVHGLPVILKGGSRRWRTRMRVFDAWEESTAAFGNGSMFVERFVVSARHIEVQILADKAGSMCSNRGDCSVQRRHQNRCWMAPCSQSCAKRLCEAILSDAVKLAKVEHTVTEEITGVDIVRTQPRPQPIGDRCQRCAMQCAVTTEDPERDFQPDSGRLECGRTVSRTPAEQSFAERAQLRCAELCARIFRVIGVSTQHRVSAEPSASLRGVLQLLLRDLGQRTGRLRWPNRDFRIPEICPEPPAIDYFAVPPDGWRKILKQKGPEAFAKAILDHPGVLLTDTTMRDAHQSLLATRSRLRHSRQTLVGLLSMECWGGATFDVSLRFLHECPWQRLRQLRDLVPNIPFQMLLRGANAVGYTNYADNVRRKSSNGNRTQTSHYSNSARCTRFCEEAVKTGMDIFRIFDCLNYVPNMLVGMDAVRKAGGVVEAAICYTGDLLTSKKYTLEYYLDTAEQLIQIFSRVFVKLCFFSRHLRARQGRRAHPGHQGHGRPVETRVSQAAGHRFEAEIPDDRPLHIHTHDTAGAGVATLLACSESGADILDVSVDAMSGITAQPSMAPLSAASAGRPASSLPIRLQRLLGDDQAAVRQLRGTNTMRSGNADVYDNEIPGGQYTNLHFQSISLGLADQFALVTPSSKVVGDLAQFMVQNKLSKQDVLNRASELSFPLLGGAVLRRVASGSRMADFQPSWLPRCCTAGS
uniref:Pyruvate carboxyltransferase domain-containing protein n=1 Tax=Macrostomum lignano TaxID=282301 RepID=A0A1I8F507_9PLAT